MKIRFEFEIDPRRTLDLRPADFTDCETLDELHDELLEQPMPSWRVSIDPEQLSEFWAQVQAQRNRRRANAKA